MTAPLWTAQPCDATDPAPGVRLLRMGERQQRLSVAEALRFAGDILAASIAPLREDGEGSP